MTGLETIHSAPDARVLSISNRLIDPVISRCLRFEFEDVVAAIDHVDLVGPLHPRIASPHLRRAASWVDSHLHRHPRRADHGGYQLLFFGAQMLSDFAPLIGWRESLPPATVRACYIEELYAWRIPSNTATLEALKRFDMIFVGYEHTVEPLARATGLPVHCVPASVDTLALCPFPRPPTRVIDFYAMGRRPMRTHAALLERANRGDWFYHFDTVSESRVTTHAEHRRRFADLLKRTRYFLVNPALCNVPEKTAGQRELAFRYFEGAAGGTVMIGDLPEGEATNKYMGWNEAVIPLPYDSADINDIIDELDADPERVDRIRKTNVVNSLRRNDHVYRWGEMLRIAGLPETPEMEARRRLLNKIADEIELTIPGAPSSSAGRSAGTASQVASIRQSLAGQPLERLDSRNPR